MAESSTTISKVQFTLLRDYLDGDCQMHLSAPHRYWQLDSGKLITALEHAGVAIELDDNNEKHWPRVDGHN